MRLVTEKDCRKSTHARGVTVLVEQSLSLQSQSL